MLREYLKSLADRFRSHCPDLETLNAQDFPDAIDYVWDEAFVKGVQSADTTEAFENGKKQIWDMATNNGKRTVFYYMFYQWNFTNDNGDVIFVPPIDLRPTIATSMFSTNQSRIDLQEVFENADKVLDFSNCTVAQQCFYATEFTRIGKCDWSKCANLNTTYRNSYYLVTIDEIVFSASVNYNFTNTFAGCTSLQNVVASGSLATSGLDLSACPLTRASKLSFLNILEPTSTTKTIVFGAGESLTDEDVAIGTQKGWSVTV